MQRNNVPAMIVLLLPETVETRWVTFWGRMHNTVVS